MQDDGNLVIYSELTGECKPKWATNTCKKGKAPYCLIVNDDGKLVLHGNGKEIWKAKLLGKGSNTIKYIGFALMGITAALGLAIGAAVITKAVKNKPKELKTCDICQQFLNMDNKNMFSEES